MPTVLITGANRGIGRGFVDRFNAAGWRVISTCRDPSLAGLSGEVHPLDVTEQASVNALVTALNDEPIDLLLNNAGIFGPRTYAYDEIDYDAWSEVLSIDAMAPIRVAAALTENVAANSDQPGGRDGVRGRHHAGQPRHHQEEHPDHLHLRRAALPEQDGQGPDRDRGRAPRAPGGGALFLAHRRGRRPR